MELEKTEFGFKVTAPLITEDEMKIINNDFDNTMERTNNKKWEICKIRNYCFTR